MEGIETLLSRLHPYSVCMSVGAPTWRGLKRPIASVQLLQTGVSRCPDMEGIETITFA